MVESEEELGLRTMGLGRTPGQDLLTAEPQREGFPETEEGETVLKKAPAGSSPWRLLWEMLKESRLGRLANCFGRPPVRLLKDKSTFCKLLSLDIAAGIGPVSLFCDTILENSTKTNISKTNKKIVKESQTPEKHTRNKVNTIRDEPNTIRV